MDKELQPINNNIKKIVFIYFLFTRLFSIAIILCNFKFLFEFALIELLHKIEVK